jgi:hypothetical protein
MKNRLFSVAGVSRLHGEVKVRFATDLTYVKGLTKAGNTDVELIDAGSEMTKDQLVEFLKTTALYQNPEYQAAIDARAALYTGKDVVKATKSVKPKAKAKAKPSLADIKARAEAEAAE